MTNLHSTETKVTVGDSGTLTEIKCGNWHVYQKRDRKLHCVKLSDMALIPSLHANLFRVAQVLQNVFQMISKYEALISKKNPTKNCFEKKIVNNNGKGTDYMDDPICGTPSANLHRKPKYDFSN